MRMGDAMQDGPTDPVVYRQQSDWRLYARQVLLWNWLAWLLNFADRGLIGPLLPLIIIYFHISYAIAGSIVSLFFVGYLSTFVGGFLSDRFGRKRLTVFSIFGFGLATCATSLAGSIGALALIRVVTGAFEGLQYPAGAAWVSETFPHRQRGRALAFWETGYSIGTLLGIVLATLIGARFGWRAAWPVSGVLTIIVGILFALRVKERPRHETPGHDEAVARALPGTRSARFRDVLKVRNVWVVFVLHGLYNFTFWMAGAWIPEYVIKMHHMTLVSGGMMSALLFGGVSAGLLLSGYVSDRIGRVRAISFLSIIAALALFVFTRVESPVLLFASIAFGGIFGAYIPTAIALVTDAVDPAIAGTAFGVATFGGEVGAVLGPITGGLLAQKFGFNTAVTVLPVSLLAASIIVWFAKEPRHTTFTTVE